jgi:AraC-like DNA-binding protein
MARAHTVPVRAVEKIIDAASAYNVQAEKLYRAVGLDPTLLKDPDNRIPFAQLVALYECASKLTGDDAFGLHVGERSEAKLFDILGYALINSPTFGDAINRLVRYHSIWAEGAVFNLVTTGARAQLAYEYVDMQGEACRHDCEMTLAIMVSFGRQVTGIDWSPQEVSFQHSKPADVSEHKRIFRAPLHFDSPVNELILDRSLLDVPLVKADPALCAVLDRHAESLLAQFPRQDSFTSRVRQAVCEALNDGEPRLEDISRKLGISTRTFQRKLREEGTCYQDLLDDTRLNLSRRYLQEPELAICEVAYILGFSEPSAFYRAFRRWTGITPKEFRQSRV